MKRTSWYLACCLLCHPLAAQTETDVHVDASWPMALPADMILGQVSGIAVDRNAHVWIVQRPRSLAQSEMGLMLDPPLAVCCRSAPAVIEFDPAGNFIQGWGGPRWDQATQQWTSTAELWPQSEHGIYIDDEHFVWLAGNGENDHMIYKFTATGELVLTIGQPGETGGSNDTARLGRPADVVVDTEAREVYIADGYLNRRVIVFDSDTGEYKRHWGAYGNRPDDGALPPVAPDSMPSQQFRGAVHSVELSNDGRVYVADRASNRIQVFERSGIFVLENQIAAATLGNGSAWDIALSSDAAQRWVFLADGQNMKVWILDRETLQVVSGFGRGGRQAGQFDWVHNIAVDDDGNLYTAEVNNGRRVQKFTIGEIE